MSIYGHYQMCMGKVSGARLLMHLPGALRRPHPSTNAKWPSMTGGLCLGRDVDLGS